MDWSEKMVILWTAVAQNGKRVGIAYNKKEIMQIAKKYANLHKCAVLLNNELCFGTITVMPDE